MRQRWDVAHIPRAVPRRCESDLSTRHHLKRPVDDLGKDLADGCIECVYDACNIVASDGRLLGYMFAADNVAIRHFDQLGDQRHRHYRQQRIPCLTIACFEFAQIRLEQIIGAEAARIASDPNDAAAILECSNQQSLQEYRGAIGPARTREIIQSCPITRQCDAVCVEALGGHRQDNHKLLGDGPLIRRSSGLRRQPIELRRGLGKQQAAASERHQACTRT